MRYCLLRINRVSMALQSRLLCFFLKTPYFHISVLSHQKFLSCWYLATDHILHSVWPCKTASCVLCWKFHILTVLSYEPEIMQSLSLVIAKLVTWPLWPCKTASCVFSWNCIFLPCPAHTETIYLLSLVTAYRINCRSIAFYFQIIIFC